MRHILGIDFGTTNSCVAVFTDGKPLIIPNSEGSNLTPSIVSFVNETEIYIGAPAKRQALLNPQNTVISAKKLLGRKFSEIAEFAKTIPYKVFQGEFDEVKIKIREQVYSPQEVVALILQKLKLDAEVFLATEIHEVILTAPSKFGIDQIKALKEAAEIAGLRPIRIISEPTAACLAYGISSSNVNTRVSIFDLGGGSLDVSIIETDQGVYEVLSTYGDTNLGGDDFDFEIVKWLIKEFHKKENLDLSKDERVMYRLKEAAEKAKIELSQSQETNIYIPFIPIGSSIRNLEITLTKEVFKNLCEKLIEKSKDVCSKAISISNREDREKPNSSELLFVGGSTRIPFIKEEVSKLFGIKLNNKINPDEVVCLGAAIQGGILNGKHKDCLLLDVTSNSFGIKVFRDGKRVFLPLIPESTTIPTRMTFVFLDKEDREYVANFNLAENERIKTKKFQKFIQEEYLPPINLVSGMKVFEVAVIESTENSEKILCTLTHYVQYFKNKINRIEITFDIDANGKLIVSISDKESNKIMNRIVDIRSNINDSDKEKLISKFKILAKNRNEIRKKQEIINSAEQVIFQSEKQLLSFNNSISQESSQNIFVILDELKNAIQSKDFKRIIDTTRTLEDAWKYTIQEIYLNINEMKNTNIKIFISYAHADNEKGLVDLFCSELRKQLKVLEQVFSFEIFKDDEILMGEDWHKRLQSEVRSADVAILLLSSSFLSSDYISKNELAIFLEENHNKKTVILCPVYFDPFNFSKYQVLKRFQFFKPNGADYGPNYAYLKDDLCFGDLVEFDPQTGLPLPNRNRSRYMTDFVGKLEKVLKK